ncbi:MAG: TetR/AcrR family transcriptional regulator [Candidatus Izemoplasmataceae bacterium]
MPKETFTNLSNVKQEAITLAIQKAFLDKPMTKITVSDIVKYASIPRGSFYQYFEDLEDVFKYLVDYSLKAFEQTVLSRVEDAAIPFFDYLENALEKDYTFLESSPHQKIVHKFFSQSSSYTVDFNSYLKRREAFYHQIINHLDLTELQSIDTEKITPLYTHINQVKMQYIQRIMKERITLEQAKEEYLWFITIIRKGLKEF